MKITKSIADKAYRDGKPIMTDSEYDEKFGNDASDMDTSDENSVWPIVDLTMFMGSLLKIKNDVGVLTEWATKYSSKHILWSDKLDGSSGELTYQDGKLVKGVTRGNGKRGNNITPNVLKMKVPKTINRKGKVVIRCEFILFLDDWKKYMPDKKNPRNAAAGAVNKLDGTNCKYLRCLAFDIEGGNKYSSKFDKFEDLKSLGFEMPRYGRITHSELSKIVIQADSERQDLPYEVDGIVFDADNIEHFNKLGFVNQRPRAARAFKFADQSAETIIKEVVWQVGKIGAITPVGLLEPTYIAGVTIGRVMLNNPAMIADLGLGKGCKATLIRANDVIPKITSLIKKGSKPFDLPRTCPSCGTPTTLIDNKSTIELGDRPITVINKAIMGTKAQLICPNFEDCSAQSHGRIVGFLKALDVKGFGGETVEKLLNAELIDTPADLYTINTVEFSDLEGMSDKVVNKLLKELHNKSAKVTLPIFIKALCISGFSASSTEKAMQKYDTIGGLRSAKYEDLESIEGVGDFKARSLIKGLELKSELIDDLLEWITIQDLTIGGKLDGMSFCFTGFRDKKAEVIIKELGGVIKSSAVKDLTYLVAKSPTSRSSKIEKARINGSQIIGIDEMLEMLK